jgi:hypothetical protein
MGVDPAIIVALISSAASLLIAISTAAWTARQNSKARHLQRELADLQATSQGELERLKHSLNLAAKKEERLTEAKLMLDRIREPLLTAASDLGERIDNIRNRNFLVYLHADDHRRQTALLSTQFRVARYFGRLESLYATLSVMRFERDEDTKTVAGLLADIGRAFATDRWEGFMLWREEQRAIGELMLQQPAALGDQCAGYSAFVDDYESKFKTWFTTFTEELERSGASKNARLARLQELLARLVIQLDEGREYVQMDQDGRVVKPTWVASSN